MTKVVKDINFWYNFGRSNQFGIRVEIRGKNISSKLRRMNVKYVSSLTMTISSKTQISSL